MKRSRLERVGARTAIAMLVIALVAIGSYLVGAWR